MGGISTPSIPASAIPGSGAAINSAVSVQLTQASARILSVTMTAAGQSIILPDFTGTATGGPAYIITATADSLPFAVRNFANAAVASIAPKGGAIIDLVTNGTPSGVIAARALGTLTDLVAGLAVTRNAVTSQWMAAAQYSPTQALVIYNESSGTPGLRAQVMTANADGSVTAGVLYAVPGVGSCSYCALAALVAPLSGATATQLLAGYRNNTSTFAESIVLTPSGTGAAATVAAGAVRVVSAADSTWISVAGVSAVQGVIMYSDTTTRAATLNVVGTSVTNGAIIPAGNGANASTYTAITGMTGTRLFSAFYETVGPTLYARTLDITGTNIATTGGLNSIPGNPPAAFPCVGALTAIKALLTYQNTATTFLNACTVAVGGGTPTPSAAVPMNAIASQRPSMTVLNSSTAACLYGDAAFATMRTTLITISGTIPAPGSTATMADASATQYPSLTALNGNKMVGAFTDTNGFLQVQGVEYSVSV